VSFDSQLLHQLVIRRMEAPAGGGDPVPGGADTTLTADTAPGAQAIAVASAAGISAGDWLRVGDAGEREAVRVSAVDALDVSLEAPLQLPHDSGDQALEVDGPGAPAVDDMSQPVLAPITVATVPGLVQPRSAREVAQAGEAGAAVGEHVGYLRPLAGLTTRDWIEVSGARYDIVSVSDAAGRGHHLELGLRRVT
jgi:hypothetical protein